MNLLLVKLKEASSNLLIRAMVGLIFLTEGIQKFLYPESLGAGRFAKIGIPLPSFTAPVVALIEISCGLLLIVGFRIKYSAIPLFLVICTAISTTKIPMFIEKGFWSTLHESRVDFAMFICLTYLMLGDHSRPLSKT